MDEINDELLNKFLDKELSKSEIEFIEKAINQSEDLRKRYLALKSIHHTLKHLKEDETSPDFISRVMNNLNRKPGWFKQQNYFLVLMYSLFIGASVLLVSYVTYGMLSSVNKDDSSTGLLENTAVYFEHLAKSIVDFFKGTNISVVGSILAFSIIISAYLFFEFFKTGKTNLNKI
ncbi:MAG: hypothetical protein IPM56_12435 [Ignavibacteriales bacterium]|nr:MAG: hypothetical protein IPM56_12435 [Ignavibacteriales bacterium]